MTFVNLTPPLSGRRLKASLYRLQQPCCYPLRSFYAQQRQRAPLVLSAAMLQQVIQLYQRPEQGGDVVGHCRNVCHFGRRNGLIKIRGRVFSGLALTGGAELAQPMALNRAANSAFWSFRTAIGTSPTAMGVSQLDG
jgi:hypothetical protein